MDRWVLCLPDVCQVLPNRGHWFGCPYACWLDFPARSVVKKQPANAEDAGLIPGLGKSLGGGNGSPHQHSCLENSMDRGAWRATVHRVTESRTRLSWAHTNAHPLGQQVGGSGHQTGRRRRGSLTPPPPLGLGTALLRPPAWPWSHPGDVTWGVSFSTGFEVSLAAKGH